MYLKLALEVLPDPNSKPTLNDCVKERLSYCEYGGLTEAAKVTLRLTTIKPRIMWMILEVHSKLTLRTVKIRTSLALRTKSSMTNLTKLALRTVTIRTT